MKKFTCTILVSCMVIVLLSSPALTASITGLFNTGVDDSGVVLPDGSLDLHYTMSGPSSLSSAYVLSPNTDGPWIIPPAGSSWIGPINGNYDAPAGDYTYTLTFNLAGFNPSTATISGEWSSDNSSKILLNGVYTGISAGSTTSFWYLYQFMITSGFHSGINTLEFIVTNAPNTGRNPTGLLVADLSGSAAPVPIPSAVWLLGSGLLGLLGIRRKLR